MNIFEQCPVIEDDKYLFRLFALDDCKELLNIYSDKRALAYFNSDNCDGDIFYYDSIEKMKKALEFWKFSYDNKWFARLVIIDKIANKIIGTIELCLRASEDDFNNMAILRVDLASEYENEDVLFNIFSLITPRINELIGSCGVITKAPLYAIDRINALKRCDYHKSESLLVGKDGKLYDNYWRKL